MTSSNTHSPGQEAKNKLFSWDANDWCEGSHGNNCLTSSCQGQPSQQAVPEASATKDLLPVADYVTSQEPSSGLQGPTSPPSYEESSHSNRIERGEKDEDIQKGKRECYEKGREPLLTGGKPQGGNTYEPPKNRLPGPAPALCSPYAFNSPLYRPYPYVHGRYGNSESPIASLQCGLNKIPQEPSDKQENLDESKHALTTPSVKSDIKVKKKNATKLRVKQPENYMGLAILICVLFNCPMGIAAIFVSHSASKHFSEGDMVGGRKRALGSLVLSLVAIVVSVLIVIMIVFLVANSSQ